MKDFKIIKWFKKAGISIFNTLSRFPAAVGLAWAATILFIVMLHIEDDITKNAFEWLKRTLMVMALGIPAALSFRLLDEKYNIKKRYKAVFYTALAGFLALYCLFLIPDFKMVSIIRYTAFSIFFWSLYIIVPGFREMKDTGIFLLHNAGRIFMSIVYGAVIGGGISLTLLAFEELMNVNFYDKIYRDVWIITAGIFMTAFFMAGIPKHDVSMKKDSIPKIFRSLLIYVFMPVITLYTTVIYIYFIRLLVKWEMPEGILGHMVLWYAIVGTGILYVTRKMNEKKWALIFSTWFPRIIILPLLLMFAAIGIRINAYGFTEPRCYVIIAGIWALGIMVYYSITKIDRRKTLATPVVLAILTLLSVIGPWNVFNISINNQNARLENVLEKNGMLSEKNIIENSNISDADKEKITGILEYFNNEHELKDIKLLPEGFTLKDVPDVFGFDLYTKIPNKYISINSSEKNQIYSIEGYEYMAARFYEEQEFDTDKGMLKVIGTDNEKLLISLNNKQIYKKDMYEFGDILWEKYSRYGNDEIMPDNEEMSFIDENDYIKIKFIIKTVGLSYEDKQVKVEYIDYIMLFNLK